MSQNTSVATRRNPSNVGNANNSEDGQVVLSSRIDTTRHGWPAYRYILSAVIGVVGSIGLGLWMNSSQQQRHIDPLDYKARTEDLMRTTPLIDGHNDLPYLLRIELKNRIYDEDKFSFVEGKHI